MRMDIKKLNENAIIPVKGSEEAAGYDLFSNNEKDITISAHSTVKIGTGLALSIPGRLLWGGFLQEADWLPSKGFGLRIV